LNAPAKKAGAVKSGASLPTRATVILFASFGFDSTSDDCGLVAGFFTGPPALRTHPSARIVVIELAPSRNEQPFEQIEQKLCHVFFQKSPAKGRQPFSVADLRLNDASDRAF
jgi:hypothetical protein